MTRLIVTNGDTSADLLTAAGCDGAILPWRDVLHEGPVVPGALETCSAVRIPWLARRFALAEAEVGDGFAERDMAMADHADFAEVELWFEHDLYDQLQLMQVLAHFAHAGRAAGVTLVQADDFLGHQTPDTIMRFRDRARPVTDADLAAAARLWQAFAAGTPADTVEAAAGASSLPFAASAVARFVAELPSTRNGLSLTEQGVLDDLAGAPATGVALFRAALAREEAAFMGDLSFFLTIRDLAACAEPLLAATSATSVRASPDERYRQLVASTFVLTETGAAAQAGNADHVRLNGVDRWWGGTQLSGRQTWRVDGSGRPVAPPKAQKA